MPLSDGEADGVSCVAADGVKVVASQALDVSDGGMLFDGVGVACERAADLGCEVQDMLYVHRDAARVKYIYNTCSVPTSALPHVR